MISDGYILAGNYRRGLSVTVTRKKKNNTYKANIVFGIVLILTLCGFYLFPTR